MKIAIDTFGCQHAKSGLGSYVLNLVANLPLDGEDSFELFGSEVDRYIYSGDLDIPFTSVAIPDDAESEKIWHTAKLKKTIRKQKYDVVIYPAIQNVIPKSLKHNGLPVINTVLSKSLSKNDLLVNKRIVRTLSKAKKIIASSDFIKKDLINLGIDPKKISVIYNGIDHKLFYPSIDNGDVVEIQPFSIKRPYFIYSSRLSGADKKHLELIKAFELFKKQTNLPHRLILAGDESDYSEEIRKAVFDSPNGTDIFITGHFPLESLAKLYSGAEACVFPAINEGVGLPILESMACGIPVLCSNTGALKEFGTDIPLYFDSNNIEEMADCMSKIVSDSALREEMIERGLKRSAKFSWKSTINQTLDLIKKEF